MRIGRKSGIGAAVPEITLQIPVVGNRWPVGLAFQLHIVIVAFILTRVRVNFFTRKTL